jgi:hypothetical protein
MTIILLEREMNVATTQWVKQVNMELLSPNIGSLPLNWGILY